MDPVSRLIRCALVVLAFFAFSSANAALRIYPGPVYNTPSATPDAGAACASLVNRGDWDNSCTVGLNAVGTDWRTTTSCRAECASGYKTDIIIYKTECPSGGEFREGPGGKMVCASVVTECPPGEEEGADGVCRASQEPPPVCDANKTLGDSSSKWYWKGKGSTTCQQGCLYIADQFAYDKQSGYSVGWGRLNGLGATCTTGQESAGDNPPDNKPPNKCDPGKCTGTINGVAVCVKCGNGGSVDTKTETETKDPDGEGGEPGETTSTKTDTKTTCDDGKCQTTTTTTTTNGDGTTKTETKTEDQSQDEFCAKNPDHALCKEEESKFEGGCQSGFRCEGDAVQCAMAREQHQRMCQLLDTETDLSTLGKRVGSGEDAADVRAQLGTGVAPVDVSGQLASATPLGPNSGCPADVSVGNWTIPFSRMCPHLNTLGNALIGLSWLVAALIVFRRAD